MGSWNETCAISNLPIGYGDDVIVMLLVQQPHDGFVCYATDWWKPLPIYFEGKYDDYGRAEDCHGPLLDFAIESLRDNLYELEQGENQFHDIPVNKNNFDIQLLFNACHNGRLFVHACGAHKTVYKQDKLQVSRIFIRKNIFFNIVNGFTLQDYVAKTPEDDSNFKNYHYVNINVQTYLESGTAFFNGMKPSIEKWTALAGDDKWKMYESDYYASNQRNWDNRYQPDYRFAAMMDEHRSDRVCNPYRNILTKIQNNQPIDDELFHNSVVCLSNVYWLNVFMHRSNRVWVPPCSGGQEMNVDPQLFLSDLIIDEGNRIKSEVDDEEDE